MLAGLAVLLAGCYSPTEPPAAFRSTIVSAIRSRSRKATRPIEVFVGSNRGGLTPAQRAEVAGLRVAVEARRRPAASSSTCRPARRTRLPRRYGARNPLDSASASACRPARSRKPYRPVRPPVLASIKINYPRSPREAGPCGLWPHDLGPSFDRNYNENQPYWNLGCATQRNLAAMVDNPADLVQPRGEDPRLHRSGAPSCSRNTARAKARRDHLSQSEDRARSATSANDQERTANRRDRHAPAEAAARDEHIAPAPRISIQAFCETVETAAAIQAAGETAAWARRI